MRLGVNYLARTARLGEAIGLERCATCLTIWRTYGETGIGRPLRCKAPLAKHRSMPDPQTLAARRCEACTRDRAAQALGTAAVDTIEPGRRVPDDGMTTGAATAFWSRRHRVTLLIWRSPRVQSCNRVTVASGAEITCLWCRSRREVLIATARERSRARRLHRPRLMTSR
jgi:hypothetical protein